MYIKYISLLSILGMFFLIQCSPPETENNADTPPPESESKITPAMAETEAVLQRVVAFKFKEGTSVEAIQQHMDDFAALKDSIPQVLSYRAGQTLSTEYEETADYDILHYITYENRAAIEEYFNHPAHQRFIARHREQWALVMVLNSEVE